jgi:hypothetical protein
MEKNFQSLLEADLCLAKQVKLDSKEKGTLGETLRSFILGERKGK